MCVCRWTFLCISFSLQKPLVHVVGFLGPEATDWTARGDCSRREALHYEGVHVTWHCQFVHGSPQLWSLEAKTISLKLPAHPPPCYCTHTWPQQSITHCRVHRFLQPYSQTSHSPVNTYCSAQNWKAVSGYEEGQLDAAATTKSKHP